MATLIELLTVYPSDNADHKRGHKYPFVVSELFACENSSMMDMFFTDLELLDKLFSFLKSEDSVTILDGYFSKLVISLMNRKPTDLLDFILTNSYVDLLIQRIHSKSIADIISKIIILDTQNPDPTSHITMRKDLISKLLLKISSDDHKTHNFSGSILSEFVSKLPEVNNWKELLMHLITADNRKILIDAISSEVPSKVCASLSIFKAFLTSNIRSELIKSSKSQPAEEDSTVIEDDEVSEFVDMVIKLFPSLVKIVKRPSISFLGPNKKAIQVLGEDRMKIIDFFLCCIRADIKEFLQAFLDHGVFETLTWAFFYFEDNSIMHSLYEQFLSCCLLAGATHDEMQEKIIASSNLLEGLSKGCDGKGFSGHAVKLGNVLQRMADRSDSFSRYLQNSSSWRDFHTEFFVKRNELEKKTLGEININLPEELSSEENNFEESSEKIKQSLSSYLKNSNISESQTEEVEEEIKKDDSPMDIGELSGSSHEEITAEKKREVERKLEEAQRIIEKTQADAEKEQQPDEEPKIGKEEKRSHEEGSGRYAEDLNEEERNEEIENEDEVEAERKWEKEEKKQDQEQEEPRLMTDSEYWRFG